MKLRYIYGPVESWRMGKSLGIDPITDSHKLCNMDCIYCQLGRSRDMVSTRKNYVSVEDIVAEVNTIKDQDIDYLTFSGRGEPTLAANIGDMIRALKKTRKEKIAVITNSTFLDIPEMQKDLMECDLVMAKLDAGDEASYKAVDAVMEGMTFENIVKAIHSFRQVYKGKLALQMMFVPENYHCAEKMANIARGINADEIQINTPLRPSGSKPLLEKDLQCIKSFFKGLPAVTVFERERKPFQPMNDMETIKRHGNYKKTTPFTDAKSSKK